MYFHQTHFLPDYAPAQIPSSHNSPELAKFPLLNVGSFPLIYPAICTPFSQTSIRTHPFCLCKLPLFLVLALTVSYASSHVFLYKLTLVGEEFTFSCTSFRSCTRVFFSCTSFRSFVFKVDFFFFNTCFHFFLAQDSLTLLTI